LPGDWKKSRGSSKNNTPTPTEYTRTAKRRRWYGNYPILSRNGGIAKGRKPSDDYLA
jgi:hypothetical protein